MTQPDEAALNAMVGATVKALREKSGLSMRELSRRSGVSQPFLSQIERGLSAPSMMTTYRLADALDVLPGALLPAPSTSRITLVRAGEGRQIPVANRADAAVGFALLMQPANPLEVLEYRIESGQHIGEWFELPGELAVYLISGSLDVELSGQPTVRLQPGDLLSHPADIPHRWLLVDDQPARVLLAIAHPAEGTSLRPPGRG